MNFWFIVLAHFLQWCSSRGFFSSASFYYWIFIFCWKKLKEFLFPIFFSLKQRTRTDIYRKKSLNTKKDVREKRWIQKANYTNVCMYAFIVDEIEREKIHPPVQVLRRNAETYLNMYICRAFTTFKCERTSYILKLIRMDEFLCSVK